MSRRALGYLLLGLATAFAALGIWRGSVRLFGTLDDHWVPRIIPAEYRPEALTKAVEKQREELATAKQGGDAGRIQQAEDRLKRAEREQAKWAEQWDKAVARSPKVEAAISVGCLVVAFWLGRMGWRRLQPVRGEPAEPGAAPDPARDIGSGSS
jgi:hypothetical protein